MIARDQWKEELAALTLVGATLLNGLELDWLSKIRAALEAAAKAGEIGEQEPSMFSNVCVASWKRQLPPMLVSQWEMLNRAVERARAEPLPCLARVFAIALNARVADLWSVLQPQK